VRLPAGVHASRPWRIHDLVGDFRLEDVWALPTPGRAEDFSRLVDGISSGDLARGSSNAVRALFAIRWKVGELLGWDSAEAGLGSRVPTLRGRLPADLREGPSGPDFGHFSSLYLTGEEWAAELANRTMHGVLHVGWAPDRTGGYRGEMAVYVRPNGLLGNAYMAVIRPFRRLIVYPSMLRQLERGWRTPVGPAGRRRWTVLYDADCGFCTWLLSTLLRWDRARRLRPIGLQRAEAGELLSDLAPAERTASWHLISPTGERHSGGAALPPLLGLLPGGRAAAAGFARFPSRTDRGYRWVAEHRSHLSRWVPAAAKRRARDYVRAREGT
jgi:predicted DCC family thiol-disulfide oxidoreductase YuxK